jgi:hypothetical protein
VADEPLGLTVNRLVTLRANQHRTRLYDFRTAPIDLYSALQRAVEEFKPDVIVIDSLIAWTRRVVKKEMPASGDAAAWAEVTRALSSLAHEHDVGLLTYHHSTKDGQRYRDSTEIAAAADVLVVMSSVRGADPCLRRFESVSRMTGRTVWRAAYGGGVYELVGEGEDATGQDEPGGKVATAVLGFVREHPGCSKKAVMRGVVGDYRLKEAALRRLADRGAVRIVEAEGRGKPAQLWAVDAGEGETK